MKSAGKVLWTVIAKLVVPLLWLVAVIHYTLIYFTRDPFATIPWALWTAGGVTLFFWAWAAYSTWQDKQEKEKLAAAMRGNPNFQAFMATLEDALDAADKE